MEIFNGAFAAAVRIAQEPRTNFPIIIGGVAEQFARPENLAWTGTALALCSAIESVRRVLKTPTPIEVQPLKVKTLNEIMLEIGMDRVGEIKPRP